MLSDNGLFPLPDARNLCQIEPLCVVICKPKGAMTDKPSTHSQPSMDDILASIRRIIDNEDTRSPVVVADQSASVSSETAKESANAARADAPQYGDPFEVDDKAAAIALAEYDAAMAINAPDPAEETIFPQRESALWRRVAGHPIMEDAPEPLPADDTFELTEVVDDQQEVNALLDSVADDSAAVADAESISTTELLSVVASDPGHGSASFEQTAAVPVSGDTAYGDNQVHEVAAEKPVEGVQMPEQGAPVPVDAPDTSEQTPPEFAATFYEAEQNDLSVAADDSVIDLTRDSETVIPMIADVARVQDGTEDGNADLPPPVFERIELEQDEPKPDPVVPEALLDQSFDEAAAENRTHASPDVLPGDVNVEDVRERALDERFYDTGEHKVAHAAAPEAAWVAETSEDSIQDGLSQPSQDVQQARHEGAPTEDEMETVGGLVRDALRGRLSSMPQGDMPDDALVSGGAEKSAARSLAALARYDSYAPRRIYGGIKITDDEDSPTIEGMVQDTLRPMLRDWLNENLPTLVETMVKQEVDRISARSRQFVRDDE